MRLRFPLHGAAADVTVAMVFFATGQAEAWSGMHVGGDGAFTGSHAAAALIAAGVTLPLAWRRGRPTVAAALVAATLAGQALLVTRGVSFIAGLLPLAVMVYSVAAWGQPDRRWPGVVCLLAAWILLVARIPELRSSGELVFGVVVPAATWLIGDRSAGDRGRAQALESERRQWRAVAVAEERGRIARELHDVVAHSVSLMGVQAGAARVSLDADPESAREALHAIEATARDAVLELRRLLTILRDADVGAGLAPQPGLAELDPLVASMRAAGLPVELSVEGDAVALPPGVALSAYRIVQEALTNSLKHAGAAPTAVRIAYGDDRVTLEVADQGVSRAAESDSRGHGLIGMHERVALYGGTLEAAPRPEGGYRVRASLPSR